MSAKILDGKKLSEKIKSEIRFEVLALEKQGIAPGLAVIMVGKNNASEIYVKNKERSCQEVGIYSEIHKLNEKISQEELLSEIEKLNTHKKISGILVQLPLPKKFDSEKIMLAIDPQKDVDCFHPLNIGRLFLDQKGFLPCTPAGIIELLKKYEISVIGKKVTIVGRSNIVGKPLALMLINLGATVTSCNSKTQCLKEECLSADILISASGQAGLISQGMVKTKAVVVDVGINRNSQGRLCGDVDFDKVKEKASAITPVPGGIGPMTIAMLLKNTVYAAKQTPQFVIRKYEN